MLMIGGNSRIFGGFVLSLLLLLFGYWGMEEASRLGGLMLIVASLHSIIVAYKLMDSDKPVFQAGAHGLRVHPKIASQQTLDWHEVKQLSVLDLRIPAIPLPFMVWLIVRTDRKGFFDQQSRMIPTSFIGAYFFPVRLLRGGGKAARQFVGLANKMRETDRAMAMGEDTETDFDRDLRWSILEKMTLPMGKDGPDDEAVVSATQQATMRMIGVHDDLLPDEMVDDMKRQPAIRELEQRSAGWARQVLEEEREEHRQKLARGSGSLFGKKQRPSLERAPDSRPQPIFGKKQPSGIMLNGKPLEEN